jgi:ribonuclease HII
MAAAVILPLDETHTRELLSGVNDSKQLSAANRERLFPLIVEHALAFGIGSVDSGAIDEMGIIPATKRAMSIALTQLTPEAEFLLIDGRIRLNNIALPQQSIIRGDGKSLSIAAASILAKVTRDRHMIQMGSRYPQYGLAQHKGYGTRQHLDMLALHGPTPIHRHSFAPMRLKLL